MSQGFVKLNIDDKRADILTRMDALHDKLLESREAMKAWKHKRRSKKLGLNDNTVNIFLNPQSARATYTSTGTDYKQSETLPTTHDQNTNYHHNSLLKESSLASTGKNHLRVEKRYLLSEPIIEDKQNDGSPIKKQLIFQSPERRLNKNKSLNYPVTNDSPVRMLGHRLYCEVEENLLENQPNESSQSTFYPLQVISQNSMASYAQDCHSNNKKYSTGSILSGQKPVCPSSHPRFKLSNKYLELSGCQWQSAFVQEEQINDFNDSNRSKCQFKQISFIPSIFQKKTIRQKKKKVNKPYIQITPEVRDKVANMIKDRLKYNQEVRETNKKGKTSKQSQTEFYQAADLQKKLKETLVKKVYVINHPKTGK